MLLTMPLSDCVRIHPGVGIIRRQYLKMEPYRRSEPCFSEPFATGYPFLPELLERMERGNVPGPEVTRGSSRLKQLVAVVGHFDIPSRWRA